jgi:hypothetical protein
MGKKAREKRERKMTLEAADPALLLRKFHAFQAQGARKAEAERMFQERLEAIRRVFFRYRRLDTAVALCISDLWPANVASPVKHIFAWGVLLDLEPSCADALPIESYAEFSTFAQALYAAWPEFPMLEDFTPEADWGQTRVRLGFDFVSMFYGSCIERTPDFVEAFRISYAHLPEALAHMDLAVAVQTRIINAIPSLRAMPIVEPLRGTVEVPPEDFWEACRSTLLQVGGDIADWRNRAGHALETAFGAYKAPLAWNAFGDAAMQGIALPFLAVVEGNDWVPVSVRSGPGIVVDYWAAQQVSGVSFQSHRRLARFIVERFRGTLMGPLTMVVDEEAYDDLPVSCVISAESGVYLICACDHASNERLSQAAKRVYGKLRQGAPTHFLFSDGRPVRLSKDGAAGPSADELRILIVLTQSSTALGMIEVPERPTRLMGLADFITIFDSLEDLSELDRYWKFVDEQRAKLAPFSTGAADLFASFRDSHGVMVDGATSPDWIGLDPHWGTTWRFRELTAFWSRAPRVFPDGSPGWELSEGTEGVVVLASRHHKAVAYSTTVGACTVQAMVVITPGLAIEDARLIDLFAQLLADSLYRCKDLISDASLFGLPHLVFSCEPDPATVIDTDEPPEPLEKFAAVVVSVVQDSAREGKLRLVLDVGAVLAGLNAAKDGSFEIRCLVETLALCHAERGTELPAGFADRLQAMALEPARYHLKVSGRHVDVPDHVNPVIPSPTEYKLARKRLALAIKELGLVPGRYELSEAKARIDLASERMRLHMESRLASLDRQQLLKACIEEHDALLVAGRLKIQRIRQSLSHAVEYDRIAALEEAHKEFSSTARHYRYLLEKVASSPVNGVESVVDDVLRELVGLVDWYMVLTGASDVLHNGVDVGGVEIDDSFIPEVFYSTDSGRREEQFAREYAKSRLGIELNEQDAVEGASAELLSSQRMREAFLVDAGFDLQNLIDALAVLSQAQRHGFGDELALSYMAEPDRISQVFADTIEGLQFAEASKIVAFLTLSEAGILRLSGRDVYEIDVPYWEHSKRIHRYAIRPLVSEQAGLRWGAEQASRALNIWMSSVRDGYLPADFDWPNVVPVIRQVKEGIEKQLEVRTEQIFKRHTPYVVRGLDFFKRFRGEGFDDAGDFDVLAFWPDTNTLVTVECKYNKPPYTVKDGRRLRDQIFGKAENDKGAQFSRILRRRQFVGKNRQRMLELLKWPVAKDNAPRDVELYVSRDVYFWMVHPPYPIPTKFVRVDALDFWIKQELITPPEARD